MVAINVLDKNLVRIGIIPHYTSLIWASRYVQNGDCELYLPATMEYIDMLRKDYYLTRDDDDMVCVIRKIEITTDEELGNMLIVTGIDVRCLIDQRIQQVPGKFTNALAEVSIRSMVTWAVINAGADGDVNVMYKPNGSKLVAVKDNSATLTNRITTEFGYTNAGDKIREVQASLRWGGRMFLDKENAVLKYETYKGTDRSSSVKFSPKYHTLKTSDYVADKTNMKNVTYIACKYHSQLGDNIVEYENVQYFGTNSGTDRFEQLIDSRNTSSQMTKTQIDAQFPGGTWIGPVNTIYFYSLDSWTFVVPSKSMKDWLEANVSSTRISFSEVGGVTYATWIEPTIAWVKSNSLASNTSCYLNPAPFFLYMLGLAAEDNAKHPEEITFTADVVPDLTFKYKTDYFLGDIVKIENEYGISASTRITEVLESWDVNGYTLELKFDE